MLACRILGEGRLNNRSIRGKSTRFNGSKSGGGRSARPDAPDGKRRRGRPPRAATEATETAYPGERIIHRYGNRRFYDLAESRAVTLEQIAELARKRTHLRILDIEHQSQDITRRVLTQVLLESELELLPVEFLRKLVGHQDKAMAAWLRQYLLMGAELLDRNTRPGSPTVVEFQQRLARLLEEVDRIKESKQIVREVVSRTIKHHEITDQIDELRKKIDELSKMRGY
jgi:polyhydroxyalkanoate synthesis repressor PhaR